MHFPFEAQVFRVSGSFSDPLAPIDGDSFVRHAHPLAILNRGEGRFASNGESDNVKQVIHLPLPMVTMRAWPVARSIFDAHAPLGGKRQA